MTASHGAHLTQTSTSSTPSIFDVLSQEGLLQLLKPAVIHVLRILVEYKPEKFGWLYSRIDEILLGASIILEKFYLSKFSSSFSENIYGLKRVNSLSSGAQLNSSRILRSLMCLSFVPYIKEKLDKKYECLRHQSQQNIQMDQNIYEKAFLAAYPWLHMAWEGSHLVCQLLYIFSFVDYHTLLLPLAGTRLQYSSPEDQLRSDKPTSVPKSMVGYFFYLVKKIMGFFAISVSTGLSLAMFFLQFLQWWYSSDHPAMKIDSLPNPGPPKKVTSDKLPKLHTICPICNRIRKNHAALSTSGFVFCYTCIHKYISQYSKCPITGYPSSPDQIVKIYTNSAEGS